MTKLVTLEMSVGLTEPIRDHLQVAIEYQGIKASTFGRQAILEKLVRDGWMKHPMHDRINAANAVNNDGAK
jgi:hypothetical protein